MTKAGLIFGLLAVAAKAEIRVDMPPDSPLFLVSMGAAGSRVSSLGGALVVDVKASVDFRNTSNSRVRGVTLLVAADELTAGGKASVSVPSLNAAPGEVFSIPIDLRLLRPRAGMNVPVRVTLDGVLFDTLAFYGPNKLDSRRTMTAWELEARRDRALFAQALREGRESLRRELVASLARQEAEPRGGVQVMRGRPLVSPAVMQIAALNSGGAPVEILGGEAQTSGNEIGLPRIELRNRSAKPVTHVEVRWIMRDKSGREHAGGALSSPVTLAAGAKATVEDRSTMRFADEAAALTGFVSSVQYEGGAMWIPERAVRYCSPEEQRLTEMYRRRGIDAVIAELDRLK